MKVILEGIVGSKAYGLSTNTSDTDVKGIFVLPTQEILSLHKSKDTINRTDPDIEHHEVQKFINLACKCNPTILELLFLDDYIILTKEGQLLLENRQLFLSKNIYKSYGGYAVSQAKKLYRKGIAFNRYEKHSRHCFRLLLQGKQLLEEKTLTIKVKNPEELFTISKLQPDELLVKFEEEFKKFDAIETTLPEKPDYDKINEILLKIRGMN